MSPLKRLAGMLLFLPAATWLIIWSLLVLLLAVPFTIMFGSKRTGDFFLSDIGFAPLEFAAGLVLS